jgi:hypothetical protein
MRSSIDPAEPYVEPLVVAELFDGTSKALGDLPLAVELEGPCSEVRAGNACEGADESSTQRDHDRSPSWKHVEMIALAVSGF